MNCDACLEQLHQTLDGTAPADRAALDQHLRDCAACRAYHETGRRLASGLKLLCPPVPPSDLTSRVVAAVLRERLARYRLARRKLVVAMAIAASIVIAVAVRLWPGGPKPAPHVPDYVDNRHTDPEPRNLPEEKLATPRRSVENAVDAVASLTSRTTQRTIEETKRLLPLVEPQLPELPWQPTLPTVTLSGAGHGVSEGFEPVAMHARKAVSMLRRDLIPQF